MFNSLKDVKKASDTFKQERDDEMLSIKEIKWGVLNVKLKRSLGNDGLTSEFHLIFSSEITKFLLAVNNEAISKRELSRSMIQGRQTLIPNPNKDLLITDDWRGKTILN